MADEKTEKRIRDLREAMAKERGRVAPHWLFAAEKDVEFHEAYNSLYELGLGPGKGKALPIKTRELVAIGILAFRGAEGGVVEHMKRALKHGATKQELLEAVQVTIIPGGAPTYAVGLRALMKIEEEDQKKT